MVDYLPRTCCQVDHPTPNNPMPIEFPLRVTVVRRVVTGRARYLPDEGWIYSRLTSRCKEPGIDACGGA